MSDVKGIGEMVSRTFQINDFTAIDIGGSYIISYRHSQDCSVIVEMQENLFEYLEVSVRKGKLHVGSSKSFNTSGADKRPRVYIEAPYLESISFSGATSMGKWDKVNSQNLFISASGAVNIDICLEVEQLDITASGASNIKLDGNAGTVKISASGACNIKAGDLQARDTEIDVSGASNATIACSDNLDAGASGAARVRYTGDPAVTQRVSGAASVKRN